MRIAIIADIHSNFLALEQVINEIEKSNVDLKICLGDMIGYYDEPNKVIEILREKKFVCIKGNHEKFLLKEISYKVENSEIYGIERHKDALTEENMEFLKKCKNYIELSWKDKRLCFCHSLKDNSETYMRNRDEILKNIDKINKYDFYFYGHSHRKFCEKIDNTVIVNPGSVGQPRDGGMPSYGIIDMKKLEVEIKTINFCVDKYTKILECKKYDRRLIDIFNRNIQ